jgi:hypothetical protein
MFVGDETTVFGRGSGLSCCNISLVYDQVRGLNDESIIHL